MKDCVKARAVGIANYIIENNATVYQTAKTFGVSKSAVHGCDEMERFARVMQ